MAKLEKFDNGKNKNIKNLVIASVIILVLISAFVIYKSYALYKIEKHYDVIKAKIGDFSNTDIVLGCTIDEEKSNDAFPLKDSNYKALSTTCENGVTAEWNNETWGLDNINSNGNKQIKCTVNFTKTYLCKRATSLHVDYAGTNFGNLGSGDILTNGDAFDCDVNGDGVYNSETERFYYISDYYNTKTKSFEDDTAVLIYYYAVDENGEPGHINSTYSSTGNTLEGPVKAITNLPTTKQWSNVRLKNETRSILNEKGENTTKGGTLPSDFSYSGYAARLLTYQELTKSCGTQNLYDQCYYLSENSQQSIWTLNFLLETPSEEQTFSKVWSIYGGNLTELNPDANAQARPVIEVAKTNIIY